MAPIVQQVAKQVFTPGSLANSDSSTNDSTPATVSVVNSNSVPLSSLSPPVSEAASSLLPSVDSSPSSVVQVKKRAKTYMTKNKKYVKKVEEKNAKTSKFKRALNDLQRGKYNSLKKCAAFYKIPYSTLYRLHTTGFQRFWAIF